MLIRTIPLLAAASVFGPPVSGQTTTAIQNDQVRVYIAHEQPHAFTPLHMHPFNRVMVYLQSGTEVIGYQGKAPETVNFKAGEAAWSPKSGVHTAQFTSANPVTIVEIEIRTPVPLKPSVANPLDPVVVDPKHYKIEFENNQVRVLRVKIGPHESTPEHKHALNRVVTYLTDQDIRVTTPDGKVQRTRHKAGEVVWAGPAEHKEENLSDHPFEVVVTELK